ncbi:MAG TPA: hypothetical protein VLA43_01010 [Longimicrobiales bacterium]|nr:hypothetical protein [Longimicrobiales bacterium]
MRIPTLPLARSVSLLFAMAVISSACGEGSTAPNTDETGLTVADLVGSWKASSLVFTNNANSTQQFDVVASGGELRTTILTDGRARTWLTVGDFSDEWDALLTLNGDQLTSTPAEATRPTQRWTVTMVGNQITLTRSDGEFDFTLSGADPVPASERVVLVPNV